MVTAKINQRADPTKESALFFYAIIVFLPDTNNYIIINMAPPAYFVMDSTLSQLTTINLLTKTVYYCYTEIPVYKGGWSFNIY